MTRSFSFLAREAVEYGAFLEGEAITLNRMEDLEIRAKLESRNEDIICAISPPKSPESNILKFRPITPESKPAAKSLLSKRKRLDNEGGKNNLKKSKQF